MTNEGLLRDVKVADFSWIGVGPLSSLWLSWHGATTIRLESTSRVDGIRFVHPFKDGIAGVNRGAYYACYNVNKLGMTCNLNTDRGREVARRLIEWSDVVVENFTPKAMRGWGLDYASIVEFKPDIIMLSASLQGQDGPEAMRPGFGNMLQGMAGFNEMIGWPDRGPSSVSTTYTDWLVPYFGATALMAALIHKQRTGEGQYIDLSQYESAMQFLGASFLDGSVNGRVEGQVGNDLTAGGVRYVAPHGVYRCASTDGETFVALAALDDDQWAGIAELAADPALAESRFATNAGRCEQARDLDALLESWTATQTVESLVERLWAKGVPAGVVRTPADLDADPQLAYRKHFVPVPHTEIGEVIVDMPAARLSDTPAAPASAGPCIGEHNELVYQKLLGYTEEEYYEMLALGVVELWEH
ncbi:MAG: CaiB/BaiF CoA transferase family protein [Acidimicrobiales bacterium]